LYFGDPRLRRVLFRFSFWCVSLVVFFACVCVSLSFLLLKLQGQSQIKVFL
jgi:hypothetical protein